MSSPRLREQDFCDRINSEVHKPTSSKLSQKSDWHKPTFFRSRRTIIAELPSSSPPLSIPSGEEKGRRRPALGTNLFQFVFIQKICLVLIATDDHVLNLSGKQDSHLWQDICQESD
jgi:hypothetical protein